MQQPQQPTSSPTYLRNFDAQGPLFNWNTDSYSSSARRSEKEYRGHIRDFGTSLNILWCQILALRFSGSQVSAISTEAKRLIKLPRRHSLIQLCLIIKLFQLLTRRPTPYNDGHSWSFVGYSFHLRWCPGFTTTEAAVHYTNCSLEEPSRKPQPKMPVRGEGNCTTFASSLPRSKYIFGVLFFGSVHRKTVKELCREEPLDMLKCLNSERLLKLSEEAKRI